MQIRAFGGSSLVFGFCSAWNEELRVVSLELKLSAPITEQEAANRFLTRFFGELFQQGHGCRFGFSTATPSARAAALRSLSAETIVMAVKPTVPALASTVSAADSWTAS